MKNQVETNDIKSRKAMAELRDQFEVKGLVNDMIGQIESNEK